MWGMGFLTSKLVENSSETQFYQVIFAVAVGEGANFTAYAFAPASLVTSLGALSILVSSFLASKFLNEHLSWIAKVLFPSLKKFRLCDKMTQFYF